MNQPDYLFLIGGADLEMLAINRLLTANGFAEGKNLADHHLVRSIILNDYQNLFNDCQAFAGIQLLQITYPFTGTNTIIKSNVLNHVSTPHSRMRSE